MGCCFFFTTLRTQQESWQEVRLRSLPERMTQAKGEKENNKAASLSGILQSFSAFQVFLENGRKERA